MARVHSTGLVSAVIVDGSFVTRKHDPGDIDLVLVLPSNHDLGADLPPIAYNVLSRRRVRRRYGFDILFALEEAPEYRQYTDFFQQVRDQPYLRKGMLRIRL